MAPLLEEDSSSSVTPSDVRIHIYQCDPYTGFLNRALLKQAEVAIYHAGIEVYDEEWSFQYFEDTWDDSSTTGIVYCTPKQMLPYQYLESINLGPTPLSERSVKEIIANLQRQWPASSYHLTRRNCLTFAEHLVNLLQTDIPFPAWLTGINTVSCQNKHIDALVDFGWSCAKWWMIKKHQPILLPATQGTCTPNESGQTMFGVCCTTSVCLAVQRKSSDGLNCVRSGQFLEHSREEWSDSRKEGQEYFYGELGPWPPDLVGIGDDGL